MFGFGMSGSFNPTQQIPDLSGKVILVTGGLLLDDSLYLHNFGPDTNL